MIAASIRAVSHSTLPRDKSEMKCSTPSFHWFLGAFEILVLTCGHVCFAERNKYFNVSSLCKRTGLHQFKVVDGAVLLSNEDDTDQDCVVTFQTGSILQIFALRFERLNLGCNDNLAIFEGAQAAGNAKVVLSCQSNSSNVGALFTDTNFVTLKYTTDSVKEQGNGFELVVTAFKMKIEKSPTCNGFKCHNDLCISRDLVCDGVNHCGDNSEEAGNDTCTGTNAVAQGLPRGRPRCGETGGPASCLFFLLVLI